METGVDLIALLMKKPHVSIALDLCSPWREGRVALMKGQGKGELPAWGQGLGLSLSLLPSLGAAYSEGARDEFESGLCLCVSAWGPSYAPQFSIQKLGAGGGGGDESGYRECYSTVKHTPGV